MPITWTHCKCFCGMQASNVKLVSFHVLCKAPAYNPELTVNAHERLGPFKQRWSACTCWSKLVSTSQGQAIVNECEGKNLLFTELFCTWTYSFSLMSISKKSKQWASTIFAYILGSHTYNISFIVRVFWRQMFVNTEIMFSVPLENHH